MKNKNAAYIDRSAMVQNFLAIREHVKGKGADGKDPVVICVVKADAYGHGINATADVLGSAGCGFFAVSSENEADELRLIETANGRHPEILILGHIDAENVGEMINDDITCAVVSMENAEELEAAAKEYRAKNPGANALKVHVKLDTGMNRVGFPTDDRRRGQTADEIKKISEFENIRLCGIFTHFACADDELMDGKSVEGYDPKGYTMMQLERYKTMLGMLEERGVNPGLRHAANSAGIMMLPEAYFDAVRAGVIIYGLMPNGSVDKRLRPAMKMCSTVTHIHELYAGEKISYGATFTAEKTMKIATVAAGYADGFERAYSGCEVTINGKKYRQVGRICMDQFMVDITDADDVKVGDEVTLFGGDDGQSTNDLARRAGSINYEVICKVSKRVPRTVI